MNFSFSKRYGSKIYSSDGVSNTGVNFTPKMESFCTFFFTPFLELNLLLENNSVSDGPAGVELTTSHVTEQCSSN